VGGSQCQQLLPPHVNLTHTPLTTYVRLHPSVSHTSAFDTYHNAIYTHLNTHTHTHMHTHRYQLQALPSSPHRHMQ
jgi:hypothetical protein